MDESLESTGIGFEAACNLMKISVMNGERRQVFWPPFPLQFRIVYLRERRKLVKAKTWRWKENVLLSAKWVRSQCSVFILKYKLLKWHSKSLFLLILS